MHMRASFILGFTVLAVKLILSSVALSSVAMAQTAPALKPAPPNSIKQNKPYTGSSLLLPAYLPVVRPPAKPPKPVNMAAFMALKPLINYRISRIDSDTVKAIVKAIEHNNYDKAISLRHILTDKHALSLVDWLYFRKANKHYNSEDLSLFIRNHHNWPNLSTLKRKQEISSLDDDKTASQIISQFRKRKPITRQGKIRLALALQDVGRSKRAMRYIRPLWQNTTLSKKHASTLSSSFGQHLTLSDHKKRLNFLLYQHKKKYVRSAKRLFKYLDKDSKTIANLRIAYITQRRVSEKRFDRLTEAQKLDSGLLFNRAKWLRRRKRQTEAWDLLKTPNNLHSQASSLSVYDWKERRVQIRKALNNGHAPIAYGIAIQHGKLSGSKGAEASFLAGWLALRFMNDPKSALSHFAKMKKLRLNKRQIAKLRYWQGRTYQALSKMDLAQKNWEIAANIPHTYYGQLASYYTKPSDQNNAIRNLPVLQAKDVRTFLQKDIVRAIIIAHKTGMHSMKGRLIRYLSWTLRSPTHMALLAELTHRIGKKRDIIKLAKVGIYRNYTLDIYAYPTHGLPADYQKLNNPVEKNLINALVRQESEFNRQARSHVGARGLMQLMPGTARQVARQYNISYSTPMLTISPSYNVMLGSALLRDLLDKYNGSYVLTLIAYNAGPGRSNKWSKAFGNPGDNDIDAVDWVERIPFTETRKYVKKILSSLQFFRYKSGMTRSMQLMSDLKRGGTVPDISLSTTSAN